MARPRQRFGRPIVGGRTLKSGLEGEVAEAIIAGGFPLQYEVQSFIYTPEPKTYTPDFQLGPSLYLESKGRFTAPDRDKMLAARRDNPGATFVLLFQNPKVRCGRGTAAAWADKHKFLWLTLAELPAYLRALAHGFDELWWRDQKDARTRQAPARKRGAR